MHCAGPIWCACMRLLGWKYHAASMALGHPRALPSTLQSWGLMHESVGEGARRKLVVWKPSRGCKSLKPSMLKGWSSSDSSSSSSSDGDAEGEGTAMAAGGGSSASTDRDVVSREFTEPGCSVAGTSAS